MVSSIKGRFILFTASIILIAIGTSTIFFIDLYNKNFEQRAKIFFDATLHVIENGLYLTMLSGKENKLQKIMDELSRREYIKRLRIFDEDGNIHYSTVPSETGRSMQQLLKKPSSSWSVFNALQADLQYSKTFAIKNRLECQKCHDPAKPTIAYMELKMDVSDLAMDYSAGFVRIVWVVLFSVLLLVLGIYYLFKSLIERPLSELNRALLTVKQGNLDVKLKLLHNDEIGTIGKHFNAMVKELKRSRQEIESMHEEKLMRADRLIKLGELAAEMAHEINNPLGIVMSRIEYLEMEAESQSALKEFKDDFFSIRHQLSRVKQITSSILKFSKKLPQNFKPVNLIEIVDQSLLLLQSKLSKRGIRLIKNYHCNGRHTTTVLGNPQQLEQLVTNLVVNAIDALPEDGQIEIGISCENDGTIRFWCKDNGIGIPAEIQEQIFSPFFTTKPPDKGTGLGLYIVQKICANHGAKIEVQSVPNEGSTFTVEFPVASDA